MSDHQNETTTSNEVQPALVVILFLGVNHGNDAVQLKGPNSNDTLNSVDVKPLTPITINDSAYKASLGHEDEDSKQVTVKLDDHLDKAGCNRGLENDSLTLSKCVINIKEENIDSVVLKKEIDESDIFLESEENSQNSYMQGVLYNGGEFCEHTLRADYSTKSYYKRIESYHCRLCDFETKYKSRLTSHFKNEHDKKVYWYRCLRCDYRSNRTNSVKLHFNASHETKAEWFHCDLCDFKTKRQTSLRQHSVTIHDEKAKRYQCQTCAYQAKRKNDLRRHFKLVHDEEAEMYQCRFCALKTRSKSSLMRHFRVRHHKETE